MPLDSRVFELMVVTHIDTDHIDGSIILLQDKKLNIQIKEFWFNGWSQLPKSSGDTLAPLQGEFLGGLLTKDPKLRQVWNRQFDGKAVVVPDNGVLPKIELEGGAQITLLGPTSAELNRLRARWSSAIRDFTPGDPDEALRRLRERSGYKAPEAPAIFATRQ